MSRLKRAMLIGAAIAVLYAGAATACRRDYGVPTAEPTHTASPIGTPTQSIDDMVTPTSIPEPTATPAPKDSYEYANSIGLDAVYLKGVVDDDNSKNLVHYLASLPQQMRSIAENSGLVQKLDDKQTAPGLVDDKQINLDELEYFKRVMDSYKKEIEALRPWLTQLSEDDATKALALNLRNFRESEKSGSMVHTLDSDAMPLLLPQALFTADGVKRMYASEIEAIKAGNEWGHGVNPYASTMVDNITNFSEIHKKAWEVANDPKYDIFVGKDARKHFEIEAVGSTDKGLNAYEDISLLVKEGSPEAKKALRMYGRNFVEGNNGSAEQVRVEMTQIYLWSIGMSSYKVVLAGHDVPVIPLTLEDIALLKRRSQDPLFIVEIDNKPYLPFQWTRKSIVKKEWEEFYLFRGTEAPPPTFKVSELKNY